MKSYLGDTGPEGESIKSARPRAKPAASFNLVRQDQVRADPIHDRARNRE